MMIKIASIRSLQILFKSLKLSNPNGENDTGHEELICSVNVLQANYTDAAFVPGKQNLTNLSKRITWMK